MILHPIMVVQARNYDMNEKVAMILSVEASVLSIVLCFGLVYLIFPGADGAYILIPSLVLVSLLSGAMGLFIQFKKEKANLENVVFFALFNFVGVGICTYVLLTGDYEIA